MAATPLLGLSLPADGTTNWGTLVNTSITSLLDSAVAGTTTLSSDADVTLTATTEATNQARQAVLLCTGSRAALRTITAPAQSKTYAIINATTGGFGVKIIAIVGGVPTTGVTVANGKAFMVAWNGSDFVTIGVTTVNLASDVTGVLPVANGGTGQSTYTDGQLLIGNSSGNTLTKATLTAGSGVTITNGNGSINISATGSGGTVTSVTGTSPVVSSGGNTPAISLAANYGDTSNPYASKTANSVLAAPNGSAGAPSFRTLVAADIPTLNQNTSGTAGGLSATLVVGSGGTGQTTYTNGELLIGNSTGNTLTKATLTAGTGISVSNGTGSITIANTAPDQTVALTGAGATTISGTYPSFTISSVDTTYSTATQTVNGLIKLGSNTAQATAANAVTSTASRTYALQLNASGEAGVNVPWTDTTYGTASTTVNGLIKLGDGTVQSTAANAVSSDASRTYAVQLNGSGQAVVNVPWTGGSGGAVISVAGTAPIASSGGTAPVISLNAGYGDTQNPYASKATNLVLASPNGASGAPAFRALVAADIPILNQSTTGTAAGLSTPLVVGSGGTGQTTAQAAMNTFAGAVTAGAYLRGNGSNVVMTTIQPGDVPTLNQNTSGTAAGLSATLVVGSGGTGATTFTSGALLKGNGSSAIQVASAADIVGQIGSTAVTNATKLATTSFTIEESGGKLIFKYGGTTIASMTSAGVFTALSDVAGGGTP